jgi:hypothetical protein
MAATKDAAPKKAEDGLTSYYVGKIEALESTINEKSQNLRRLEAQRNALNGQGRAKQHANDILCPDRPAAALCLCLYLSPRLGKRARWLLRVHLLSYPGIEQFRFAAMTRPRAAKRKRERLRRQHRKVLLYPRRQPLKGIGICNCGCERVLHAFARRCATCWRKLWATLLKHEPR